jgi:hypothetical protein
MRWVWMLILYNLWRNWMWSKCIFKLVKKRIQFINQFLTMFIFINTSFDINFFNFLSSSIKFNVDWWKLHLFKMQLSWNAIEHFSLFLNLNMTNYLFCLLYYLFLFCLVSESKMILFFLLSCFLKFFHVLNLFLKKSSKHENFINKLFL